MITIFGSMFVLFAIIFVIVVFVVAMGFWRTHSLANKVFTLAEQELDRKMATSSAPRPETPAATAEPKCAHCGSRIAPTLTQCPNCGAKLP